jgi:hypothetical protein
MTATVSPRSSDEDEELRTVRAIRSDIESGKIDLGQPVPRSNAVFMSGTATIKDGVESNLSGWVLRNKDGHFDARVRFSMNPTEIEDPLLLLMHVTTAIEILDQQRRRIVAECRRRGRSWADIATALGTTRQSAWDRYSPEE